MGTDVDRLQLQLDGAIVACGFAILEGNADGAGRNARLAVRFALALRKAGV